MCVAMKKLNPKRVIRLDLTGGLCRAIGNNSGKTQALWIYQKEITDQVLIGFLFFQ